MSKNLVRTILPALVGVLGGLLILKYGGQLQDSSSVSKTASYHLAVARAAPSVVNIYSEKVVTRVANPFIEQFLNSYSLSQPNIRKRLEQSLGSGVIMSAAGHILTNHHVIHEADAIRVLLHDGRETNAFVVGSDTKSDLAVLKIEIPNLHAAEIADSNEVKVGDIVLAIGNPLGIGQSATQGIISGIGRYFLKPNAFEDFIQTDAFIHEGSSGGALVDSNGFLVGINALTYAPNKISSDTKSARGFGLVTPINMALFVMQELIAYGKVRRGWLGVTTEPANTPSNKRQRPDSLLVQQVTPKGPAADAGLRVGDLITAINNEPVNDGRLTMLRISMLKPGEEVEIALLRKNRPLRLIAILGEMD